MLMRVAAGMKRGIWFGTAVFDGAQESEIKALLQRPVCPARARRSSSTA
jgi:DNA-directed RNA polymerase subunit beta